MPIQVLKQIADPQLILGVAEVSGGKVGPASAALCERAANLAARISAPDYAMPEPARVALRQLLKSGGFSPTGRNRPSHELLINDLRERCDFHHINNVVDVNNVISLEDLLPISIFDVEKVAGPLTVRHGLEGEQYVFNQSNQILDLKRCIVCCHHPAGAPEQGLPIGSPVKDSMETKIFEGATRFLAVIYGSAQTHSMYQMVGVTNRFADLLADETGGRVEQSILV